MTPQRGRFLSLLVLVGAVVVVGMAVLLQGVPGGPARRALPGPGASSLPVPSLVALPADAVRVLAAGDIGLCGSRGTAATGSLLGAIPGTVLALGDNAYENGGATEYRDCYDPAWGGARDRTIPVPGNHEYHTTGAAGYFDYFGEAAGTPGAPWRTVDLGAWRLYALDSDCGEVGGCAEGSTQLTWLREDLAAHPSECVIAIWHHPRWSSGPHGDSTAVDPLWRELADAGADIVLAGHDHLYERFAPADADGAPAAGGVRSWVVGTGGAELYRFATIGPLSEARWDEAHGVLELVLRPGGYDWRFLAAIGAPFEDAGSGPC